MILQSGVKPGAEAGVAALGPKLGGIELFQHQNSFAVAVRSFVEAGDGVGIEAFGERNQSPPRHLCRDAGGLGGNFRVFQISQSSIISQSFITFVSMNICSSAVSFGYG